ncbi:hypothetical protein [Winslowiella iniecta]|uniref:Type IV secretion protein Rhs n=1 Tax=Winslowiella iniecta TaxID=1560201 RepID=A0A0L7SVS8_9GAMM|nr:hypothetical protein [Winslowiella iniecta]KOC87223.1 hypothetical protein NG42_21500 [Winslowiella iniecta]KOC87249.1 hypothetical protein NG43_21560 [Winslowiella iniecta]
MTIIEEGSSRRLTGESEMAKSVFKNAIDYRRVRVHHGGYLPFGMQNKDTAMTPNGEMYYPTSLYQDDYSKRKSKDQWLFIHEMAHVWQHQMGMNVRTRGLISWAVEYKYSLPPYYTLADFAMEQQASIIADYYILINFGLEKWNDDKLFTGLIGPDLVNKYQSILIKFLNDPTDRSALWKLKK